MCSPIFLSSLHPASLSSSSLFSFTHHLSKTTDTSSPKTPKTVSQTFKTFPHHQQPKMLRRATALIGVSAIGGYCADMTINDDWDSWSDMFRTKISAEERLKNPRKKLVILGTAYLSFFEISFTHTHLEQVPDGEH